MNQRKKWFQSFFFIILILSFFTHGLTFADALTDDDNVPQGYIPKKWHVLPEARPLPHGTDGRGKEMNELALDRTVNRIMKGYERALNEIHTQKKKRWQIGFINTRLAIGSNGSIGIGILNGRKTLELHWRPKKTAVSAKAKKENDGGDEGMEERRNEVFREIVIMPEMTKAEIESQLRPAMVATMNTGRIKDKKLFQRELLNKALEFKELIKELPELPDLTSWYLQGFRMDVIVSAEGRVSGIASVGGDLRLRFEWYRIRPVERHKAVHEKGMNDRLIHELKNKYDQLNPLSRFVWDLTQDLSSLTDKGLEGTHYAPTFFSIGVGIGASGDVFMARAGGRVVGHLLFKREIIEEENKNNGLAFLPVSGSDFYLYAEEEVNEHRISFAQKNGIEFQKLDGNKSLDDRMGKVVFKIDREKFRKGLAQTNKMARYFIQRAPQMRKWELANVRSEYELSITGSLGLVSLSGLALAQVILSRIEPR